MIDVRLASDSRNAKMLSIVAANGSPESGSASSAWYGTSPSVSTWRAR